MSVDSKALEDGRALSPQSKTEAHLKLGWFRDPNSRFYRLVRPIGMALLFLTGWGLAVRLTPAQLFPAPGEVARGIVDPFQKGLFFKYIVASLFWDACGFKLPL